jgi:type VI secretion system secreted protein Hcp
MALFVRIEGLTGEVTEPGYEGWMLCSTFNLGMGRGVSVSGGGAGRREATAPSVSEVSLTKEIDSVDAQLFKEALRGSTRRADLHFTQTDRAGRHVAFLKYVLTETIISGYSVNAGSGRPVVSFSLNFAAITSEYLTVDADARATSTGIVGWNVLEERPL